MTENVAVNLLTPLAGHLTSGANRPRLVEFRGVLTPQQLDAPSDEIAAFARSAAAHDVGWMRRVSVRGKDRFRWLNGMVTNSIKDLPTNSGAYSLVLNAQGRIQGDLTVWREDDQLELQIAADQYEKLTAHLDHFIIMDDVELVLHDPAAQTATGLTGPRAVDVLARMGLRFPSEQMTSLETEWNGLDLRVQHGYGVLAEHFEIWTPIAGLPVLWRALSTAGATPAGSAALDAFRVAEGIAEYGIDIGERDLPQETSQMRALHFDKGCYIGQEIVERIRSRGNVHRHLRSLELAGPVPEPGTSLTLDGAEAGHITSATELPLPRGVRRFAIGMIRGEAEARNLSLHYTVGEISGTASILAGSATL